MIITYQTARNSLKAYEIYHIIIKGEANNSEFIDFSDTIKKEDKTMQNTQVQDYTAFYDEAHSYISNTDYPAKRGLSQEVIDRFNIGYIAEWKHPKTPTAPISPRLIIPTGRHSYIARRQRQASKIIRKSEKLIYLTAKPWRPHNGQSS